MVLLTTVQPHHHRRNLFDSLRGRQRFRRRGHALQPPRIADQRRNRVDQISRAQIAFLDHNRSPHSFQRPRIHVLMIVSRRRKRHKNLRLPCRRNLTNPPPTPPADHHTPPPEPPRHIL